MITGSHVAGSININTIGVINIIMIIKQIFADDINTTKHTSKLVCNTVLSSKLQMETKKLLAEAFSLSRTLPVIVWIPTYCSGISCSLQV